MSDEAQTISKIDHTVLRSVHYTFKSDAAVSILICSVHVCFHITLAVVQLVAILVVSSGVTCKNVARVASMFDFLQLWLSARFLCAQHPPSATHLLVDFFRVRWRKPALMYMSGTIFELVPSIRGTEDR